MKIIYLIGYMGSGKTTLGRVAADALSARFIDLDDYIEASQSMTVSEIFAHHGESGFRQLESAALAEIAGGNAGSEGRLIVACGGGTPVTPGNIELMEQSGIIVWLHSSVDTLVRRLSMARAHRPLIASLDDDSLRQYVDSALKSRFPTYSRARIMFDSNRLDDADQIADSLDKFIRLIEHVERADIS